MKKLIFIASLLFLFHPIKASHLAGGSITYSCIDSATNQYVIRMILYRDCNGAAALPNLATLRYYAGNVGSGISFNLSQITFINVQFPGGPCIMATSGICYQKAEYSGIITLPPHTNGYTIAWSDCCRNNSISNVLSPGSISAIFSAKIPNPGQYPCNSSPVWNQDPGFLACINSPLNFDASGSDLNGDSLVYRLAASMGINSGSTNPGIPPFPIVPYSGSYTGLNPLPANPQMSINPLTGELTGIPNSLGQYVITICTDEYRNGLKIGEYCRDFQMNVIDCSSILNLTLSNDVNICLNDSTQLSASSNGAATISWSPANTLSDPNIPNPYAKPATTTTYSVTLTDTAGCTLTSYVNVNVISPGSINAGNDTTICKGASVQLHASSGANIWDPDSTLSCTNCENPIATPTVTTTYYVNAVAPSCSDRDSVVVTVLPVPVIIITPSGPFCADAPAVQLSAAPTGGLWSGPGITTLGLFDPVAAGPGAHNIQYFYINTNGCSASKIESVIVNPKITANANIYKTLNAVSSTGAIYLNVGGGQPPYNYNWSNGATSKDIINLGYGTYSVTIMDDLGCMRSYTFFVDTLYAVGVEDIELKENFIIYPNPTSDYLTVNIPYPGTNQMRLRIFNTSGYQFLYLDHVINQSECLIDIRNFPKGNYIIAITVGDSYLFKHFLIQ